MVKSLSSRLTIAVFIVCFGFSGQSVMAYEDLNASKLPGINGPYTAGAANAGDSTLTSGKACDDFIPGGGFSDFIQRCTAVGCPAQSCSAMLDSTCIARGCPPGCSARLACWQSSSGSKLASGDLGTIETDSGTIPVPGTGAKPPVPRSSQPKTGSASPQAVSGKSTQSQDSKSSAPQSTGNAQSDISTCQAAQQEAQNCCNNPASCIGSSGAQEQPPSDQAGLREYCAKMQESGNQNGNSNLSAAQACRERFTSCQTTCNSLASNYQDGTASTLQGIASSCGQLQSQASALANQAYSSYQSGGSSDVCNQVTNSNPMSLPGFGGSSDSGSGTNQAQVDPCLTSPVGAECSDCTKNPQHSSCQLSGGEGQAGFQQASQEKVTPDQFNVGDNSDTYMGDAPMNTYQPQSAQVSAVPNNSGGGIPGGGGASGPAALGGPQRAGSPGSPGYTTDINQGFQSGGGFSGYGEGGVGSSGSGSGFGGPGSNRGRTPPGWGKQLGSGVGAGGRGVASVGGIDLKQYLPGGVKDPNRRFGGYSSPANREINGMHVNIYSRITSRLQEKCRLGALVDCSGR